MTTSKPERELKFNARYLPILASVAPKNDVRYYLNGFFVTPHDSGVGAYLVATDGHHMVVIYDETAQTNGDWICRITPKLLATAKKKGTGKNALFNGSGSIQFIGNTCYVLNKLSTDMEMPIGIFEINGKKGQLNESVLLCEYSKHIDGNYPDFKRVIPDQTKGDQIPLFNPTYLEFSNSIKSQLGKPDMHGARFFSTGEGMPLIVRFPRHEEILAIVMPMREDSHEELKALPDWLVRIEEPNNDTEAA